MVQLIFNPETSSRLRIIAYFSNSWRSLVGQMSVREGYALTGARFVDGPWAGLSVYIVLLGMASGLVVNRN